MVTQRLKDRPLQHYNLPLSGKLIKSRDPTELGEGDFQDLKNMRYGDVTPKSIAGMTKINTSIINATHFKPRSGFHFKKSQPVETHNLIQAWNDSLTGSQVFDNTTVIPNQGNYEVSSKWADTTGANTGYFANAPDGSLVYCNGKDTCVWGGQEYRVASFLLGNEDETVKYDYTTVINNTLNDVDNVATLKKSSTTIDANTMLLLHCDGADGSTTFTDSSPTTPHTMTAVGTAQLDTAFFKFGTAAGLFDGNSDYLTSPDDADFDFSGGTWTIDTWVRLNSTATTEGTIYWHRTDALNYFRIFTQPNASFSYRIYLDIAAGGGTVVSLISDYLIPRGEWHHVEVSEDGNDYYIFIDGALVAHTSDTDRPANYTQEIEIGAYYTVATGAILLFNGHLDEFRVSNKCRHTSSFATEIVAYASASARIYLGSTRPLQGVKFYVGAANTSVAVLFVNYWTNSTWTPVASLIDNTSVGGKTLAQTGWVTFTSTVPTAKPRVLNKVYAYWYLFSFATIDDTTTVYYVTVDAPFQPLKDIWDGIDRSIASYYFVPIAGSYAERTTKVYKEDFSYSYYWNGATLDIAGDPTTYSSIGGTLSTTYLLCGFVTRMTGLDIRLCQASGNANAATLSVYYWNGNAWTAVSGLVDGTKVGSRSFAQEGIVCWDAPNEIAEFKYAFKGKEEYYYYKLQFSATLSATVWVDYIAGIPAQETIRPHEFPVYWQNRIWLLNESSYRKNSAICSNSSTVHCFNGSDSIRLPFGNDEPITAGATLYTRFGGTIYDNLIITKKTEVWLVDGFTPEDFKKYRLSDNYGCVAPATMVSCDMGYEMAPGLLKHVLIWQAADAIVLFDGNTIVPISDDIRNYFDPSKDECIPTASIAESKAFYDEANYEYHWLFAGKDSTTTTTTTTYEYITGNSVCVNGTSVTDNTQAEHWLTTVAAGDEFSLNSDGTWIQIHSVDTDMSLTLESPYPTVTESGAYTIRHATTTTCTETILNKEYVYSLKKKGWYEIDRGNGKYLQMGFPIRDTYGNNYTFGGIDTGYIERLENGTTFDGNSIISTWHSGDIAFSGWDVATAIRRLKHLAVSKTATTDMVAITHYGDCIGRSTEIATATVRDLIHRIAQPILSVNWGNYTYHSFKCSLITTNENSGYEPIGMGIMYKIIREELI